LFIHFVFRASYILGQPGWVVPAKIKNALKRAFDKE